MPSPAAAPAYYPPLGMSFRVQMVGSNAKLDVAFQEASGLSVDIEVETVVEGGLNAYRHRLPTVPKYGDLVLKRGYVTQELPLYQWCRKTIQGGFQPPIQTKTLTLQLLGPDPNSTDVAIVKQWSFYGAWPTKWNLSDLNSSDGKILIETLQFAYRYFDTN